MSYLSELNPIQKKAVLDFNSSLAVIAGPGSGKTKTLTAKAIYLITERQVNPSKILLLTFTQKAAQELKSRIEMSAGQIADLSISTFHSFGYFLLNKINPNKKIKIISEEIRNEILRSLKNEFSDLKIRNPGLFISSMKNSIKLDSNNEYTQLIDKYNLKLKELEYKDYDDLIIDALKLIKLSKNIHYPFILVDEFQDTNDLEYELIKSLYSNNLFVIGDPNQSIYAFRGIKGNIFETLNKDFSGLKTINLNQNYRSAKNLICFFNRIYPEKNQLSVQEEIGEIKHITSLDLKRQAEYIARDIKNKIGGTNIIDDSESLNDDSSSKFSDFAIIYRAHFIGDKIEQTFRKENIPYQKIGNESFLKNPCIIFITEILRYCNNPAEYDLKMLQMNKFLTKMKIGTSEEFLELLNKNMKKLKISQKIDYITNTSKLSEHTTSEDKTDILDLKNLSYQFDKNINALKNFIQYLDNLENNDYYDETTDKVTFLTMHKAKGLEFNYVYLVGFNKGIIPLETKYYSNLAEEKRLFYVAVTRARQGLCILSSKGNISPYKKYLKNDLVISKEDDFTEKIIKRNKIFKEKRSQLVMKF